MPTWSKPSKFVGYRVVKRFIWWPKKLETKEGLVEWRVFEMAFIIRKHVWIGHKGSYRYGHVDIRWADDYEDTEV